MADIQSGDTPDAARLNALSHKVVVKTADQTVNNSATLVDDNELVQALRANSTYKFEIWVLYESGTTPDFKLGFTLPAGATLAYAYHGFDTSLSQTFFGTTTIPSSGTGFGGNATTAPVRMFGSLVTAGTAGNFQVKFAQQTANASNTILKAGSYLSLFRVV